MFLGQAGPFFSFQARRSSAKRSSTSDLTVLSQKYCGCRFKSSFGPLTFFEKFNFKAQTNVLLALTNVLFPKANILEGSLNIFFPVVYMNWTKAA